MKIVIDARKLQFYGLEKGGIYQYVRNLILNLAKIDQENEYTLLFNYLRSRHRASFAEVSAWLPGGNFHYVVCRIPGWIWCPLQFPTESLVGIADVFHGPTDFLPPNLFGKSIVTIHDLAYLRTPSALKPEWITVLQRNITRAAKRADLIITVSQYCKADIVEALDVAEEKVAVIYHGASPGFRPLPAQDIPQGVLHKYGISRDYLLFVGTLQPNKNLHALLEAYDYLQRAYGLDVDLVLAGQQGWYYESIYAKVVDLGLQGRVVFTGYVADEDLPFLYNGARLFVTAATFEGFGIPVIEAMACGLPVICSHAGALPEVAGDAALLVNPRDPEGIAHAMSEVLTDSALREKLRAQGLKRAALFTWAKAASETLCLYNHLGR